MRYVERLEQFWREMLAPFETDLDGAVLVYNPDVPTFVVNHVACVNVDESEVESLLHRVIEYYSSRGMKHSNNIYRSLGLLCCLRLCY